MLEVGKRTEKNMSRTMNGHVFVQRVPLYLFLVTVHPSPRVDCRDPLNNLLYLRVRRVKYQRQHVNIHRRHKFRSHLPLATRQRGACTQTPPLFTGITADCLADLGKFKSSCTQICSLVVIFLALGRSP